LAQALCSNESTNGRVRLPWLFAQGLPADQRMLASQPKIWECCSGREEGLPDQNTVVLEIPTNQQQVEAHAFIPPRLKLKLFVAPVPAVAVIAAAPEVEVPPTAITVCSEQCAVCSVVPAARLEQIPALVIPSQPPQEKLTQDLLKAFASLQAQEKA